MLIHVNIRFDYTSTFDRRDRSMTILCVYYYYAARPHWPNYKSGVPYKGCIIWQYRALPAIENADSARIILTDATVYHPQFEHRVQTLHVELPCSLPEGHAGSG